MSNIAPIAKKCENYFPTHAEKCIFVTQFSDKKCDYATQ